MMKCRIWSLLILLIQPGSSFPGCHAFSSTQSVIRHSMKPLRKSVSLKIAAGSNQSDKTTAKNKSRPLAVVFDLDGCLWSPEMFELFYRGGAPFSPGTDGSMLTVSGESVNLLGDVRSIMSELHRDPFWSDTTVGISSRTDEPNWARELLRKFEIDDITSNSDENDGGALFALNDVFSFEEISFDSKTKHFERIAERTGIPMESMLFFDNEAGNCRSVAELGVTCAYCPNGVDFDIWRLALESFPSVPGEVVGMNKYGSRW